MNSNRILIVDDDTLVREVLVDYIKLLHPQYEIVEAENGSEALSQLEKQEKGQYFDLILTDYQMPVMDGLDLVRNIRQRWPKIRVVLITGYFNPAQLQSEACALKLDGLLQKPIDFAQLEKLLPHNNKLT